MDDPIKDFAVQALKFVGTSSIVATLCFLWIRSMRNRLKELQDRLKRCQKKRHEEKDEMFERMEDMVDEMAKDAEIMEAMMEARSSSDDNPS